MAFTGCRPLNADEQQKVYDALDGKRDKALFTLQLQCGFRISELLSLRVQDVCTLGNGSSGSASCRLRGKERKSQATGQHVQLHYCPTKECEKETERPRPN